MRVATSSVWIVSNRGTLLASFSSDDCAIEIHGDWADTHLFEEPLLYTGENFVVTSLRELGEETAVGALGRCLTEVENSFESFIFTKVVTVDVAVSTRPNIDPKAFDNLLTAVAAIGPGSG